jgi:putative DNA primase/helicase
MKKIGLQSTQRNSNRKKGHGKSHHTLMAHAILYAQKGYAVVPMHTAKEGVCSCFKGATCSSPGKHPWNVDGVKGASTKTRQVRKWWRDHPTANIGIATGQKSNILVLDVDPRNGGNETLKLTIQTLGEFARSIVSNTGGGGTHYVFELPEFRVRKDSAGNVFGAGLDVLSNGAIMVAPPSVHVSGKRYSWQLGLSLLQNTPGKLPKEWRNHIKARQVTEKSKSAEPCRILEGARNDALTSIAGKLHNTGIAHEALLAALLSENRQRCKPPVDDAEVAKIARSIGSKTPASTASAVKGDLAEGVMKIMLDREFRGGEHLMYCTDGQFWMFNGKHWEPAHESWLRGRTLLALQGLANRGGGRDLRDHRSSRQPVEGEPLRQRRSAALHRNSASGDQLFERRAVDWIRGNRRTS